MNKQTSKYFYTAEKMNEALLSLLEKKDFQYITVKEICGEAGVNRSTFYLHYETLGDLLAETMVYIMGKFREKYDHMDTLSTEEIGSLPVEKLILVTPEYLIPYLEFARENRRIFHVAVTQPNAIGTDKLFREFYSDFFYPIMKRFGLADYEIQYKLEFYLQGMFAVISRWIQGGCVEDRETIAEILTRCVFPGGEWL